MKDTNYANENLWWSPQKDALWRPQIAECSHAAHSFINKRNHDSWPWDNCKLEYSTFLTKELTIATLADSGSEMALQVPVGATTDFALMGV